MGTSGWRQSCQRLDTGLVHGLLGFRVLESPDELLRVAQHARIFSGHGIIFFREMIAPLDDFHWVPARVYPRACRAASVSCRVDSRLDRRQAKLRWSPCTASQATLIRRGSSSFTFGISAWSAGGALRLVCQCESSCGPPAYIECRVSKNAKSEPEREAGPVVRGSFVKWLPAVLGNQARLSHLFRCDALLFLFFEVLAKWSSYLLVGVAWYFWQCHCWQMGKCQRCLVANKSKVSVTCRRNVCWLPGLRFLGLRAKPKLQGKQVLQHVALKGRVLSSQFTVLCVS